MASNSIAKASLELTANSGGLNQGLDSAAKRFSDWQKQVEGRLKAMQKQQAFGNSLSSVTALSSAYNSISNFVGRVADAFSQLGDKVRAVVNDAKNIGTGVQGLQRIGYAAKIAGVDTKTVSSALTNMFAVLRSAQRPEALQQLGLDLDQLGKDDAETALQKIVAALEGISDPMERAKAATALFGDQTQAILPLLDKGSDGFKKLTEEAKSFGIGNIDTEGLTKTAEAVAKTKAAWEALKDTLLSAVAPAMEYVSSAAATMLSDLSFDQIGLQAQLVFDNLIWGIQSAFVQMVGHLGKAWDWLMSKIGKPQDSGWQEWMDKKQKAVTDAANARQAMYRQDYKQDMKQKKLPETPQEQDDKAKTPTNKVRDNITQQKLELAKSLNDAEQDLRNKMRTIGLTAGEQKVFELKMKGVGDKDLTLVKQLAEQAKNVEIAFNNVQMPSLETFERSLKGLNELRANGRLNEQQGKFGLFNAAKNLMSQTLTQPQTVSAAVKDSQEAASAIINARMQEQRQDPQAELRRAMMEAKEIQKRQLEVAEKMLQELQANKDFDLEAL